MSRNKWGPAGPPAEAYSRVTNPERFAPVHPFAQALLARLASEFDVEREEGSDLEPGLGPTELARSSIMLKPRNRSAAPVLVSFTTFPGLVVRAGRWLHEPVPVCGCDACDESAESAIESFSFLVESVVGGHFREELSMPPFLGDAWQTIEIGSRDVGHSTARRTRIPRASARKILEGNRARYEWEPWARRMAEAG